jgi:hypothetical protein
MGHRFVSRRRHLAGVAAGTLLALAGSALIPAGSASAQPVVAPAPSPHYVALGDSYASGEGLAPYEPATATAADGCHRSLTKSYPERLTATGLRRFADLTSVACSGAATAALFADAPDDSDEGAQLAVLGAATKTVTLTIGGNDAGFAQVVGDCLDSPDPRIKAILPGQGNGCRNRDNALVSARIAALAARPGAPTFPDEASISKVLLAIQFKAPNARIYVSGYPKLLGTKATNALGCQVAEALPIYIESADVRFIRSKATELNAAIRYGVRQARRVGVDARYVNVASRFAGHNVCDRRAPWINDLRLTQSLQLDPASFHPTNRGQRAYAKAFIAASRNRGPHHPFPRS